MRALLATNFWPDELERKILPALRKHVDVAGVVKAETGVNFKQAIDKTNPDVVLLMNEVVSHSTSYTLAEACRSRSVRLSVLGQQKAKWPELFDRLRPSSDADSFGLHLRRAREQARLTFNDVANRCGVSKETARRWEADELLPTRQELKRICGSIRQMKHHLDAWQKAARVDQGDWDGIVEGAIDSLREPETEELETFGAPGPDLASEPPRTFGEALARLRLREGMTQEELAELMGVARSAVSHWEGNNAVPVLDHYERLCDLLPELRIAPEPPTRDTDKPVGNPGGDDQDETKEESMSQRLPNPVLAASYTKTQEATNAGIVEENDKLVRDVQRLSGEVAELKRRLETAERESVTSAAEALKTLVRAGFLTEAEAASKWAARIR